MHKTAKKVYEFVVQYKTDHDGISPNLREITDGVGLASDSTSAHHIRALRRAGLIKSKAGHRVARGYEVVGAIWIPPVVQWSEVDGGHFEAEFAF